MSFVVNTASNHNFELFLIITFQSALTLGQIFENGLVEIDQLPDPIILFFLQQLW